MGKTSTDHALWFIIPSNHKWFRNLAISRIVAETLESLNMKFPEPTVDIEEITQKYHAIEQKEGIEAEKGIKANKSEGKKGKKGKNADKL